MEKLGNTGGELKKSAAYKKGAQDDTVLSYKPVDFAKFSTTFFLTEHLWQ